VLVRVPPPLERLAVRRRESSRTALLGCLVGAAALVLVGAAALVLLAYVFQLFGGR